MNQVLDIMVVNPNPLDGGEPGGGENSAKHYF